MRALISRSEVADLFDTAAPFRARAWLADATTQVAEHRGRLDILFSAAARGCGREPLSEVWRSDMAARVLLLTNRSVWAPESASRLYRHGTADERLAVLRALDLVEDTDASLLLLTRDALRSNDTRLITAALGPFGAQSLEIAEFRSAVLKCVFCGVPLSDIAGLAELGTGSPASPDRTDAELARMLAGFARERVAAGRAVPDDVWPILRRFPDAVAACGLPDEASAEDPVRAAAARQALTSYHSRETP